MDSRRAAASPDHIGARSRIGESRRPGALAGIEPALISENAAPVEAANTAWDPWLGRLRSGFVFPPILERKPIAPEGGRTKRGELPAAVLRELQGWFLRGRAAGLAGTIYDNRDRGHSGLSKADWPQLAFTRYSRRRAPPTSTMG